MPNDTYRVNHRCTRVAGVRVTSAEMIDFGDIPNLIDSILAETRGLKQFIISIAKEMLNNLT